MAFFEWLQAHTNALAAIWYVVAIVGFIPAAIGFLQKNRQDIREGGNRIYREVDEINLELNKIILTYPHLGVSWFQDGPTRALSADEQVQQTVIFDMIVAMFEKVFLAYKDAKGQQRQDQWAGWEQTIEDYCRKPDFQKWWAAVDRRSEVGSQFDRRFDEFMRRKFKKVGV